jgi:hypothetical protein
MYLAVAAHKHVFVGSLILEVLRVQDQQVNHAIVARFLGKHRKRSLPPPYAAPLQWNRCRFTLDSLCTRNSEHSWAVSSGCNLSTRPVRFAL